MSARSTAWLWVYLALALAAAAFTMAIVGLVRIDAHTTTTTHASASANRIAPPPVFRVKGNMMPLADGGLCVESAALPQGVTPKASSARRAEGRFYMTRVADAHKPSPSPSQSQSRDEGPGAGALPIAKNCVGPIVEGARWRAPYRVIVDPTNNNGISRADIVEHVWHSFEEWEARAPEPIVLGQDTEGCVDGFDDDTPDGKNEVMFGYIEEPGVLAVTVIWGIFGGPAEEREILETDMLFNLHFPWGNTSRDQFHVRNIGTHEQGHGLGMAHTNTQGATMFPTAEPGETLKQDILACEATGFCAHYGSSGTCAKSPARKLNKFVDVGPNSRCGGFGSGSGSKPELTGRASSSAVVNISVFAMAIVFATY